MADSAEKPNEPGIEREMEAVYCLYLSLAREMDAETGLGGRWLYVGEADAAACRLLRAANIAGAVSLAASADAPNLRRAMREGAIDFVVNSLDEALRILKNEIRKRERVAVGITLGPDAVQREMVERGARPDLLAAGLPASPEIEEFLQWGAKRVAPEPIAAGTQVRIVSVPADGTMPASAFDAQLLECLSAGDFVNRRWASMAPRYLPAAARRLRLVATSG